jgi:hypothetical protein
MNEQELKESVELAKTKANEIQVVDKETYESASAFVIEVDKKIKKVVSYWKEPKDQAWKAHKSIVSKEKEMLLPLQTVTKQVKQIISVYLTEEERKRQEAQRKLDEERRQKEEAERKKADDERKRLEAEAKALEDAGKEDEALEILEQADEVEEEIVEPEIVEPGIEKTSRMENGTASQQMDLEIEVVNLKELCKEISEGRAPEALIDIKKAPLKSFVKLNQHKTFPGLRIKEVVKASFRSK